MSSALLPEGESHYVPKANLHKNTLPYFASHAGHMPLQALMGTKMRAVSLTVSLNQKRLSALTTVVIYSLPKEKYGYSDCQPNSKLIQRDFSLLGLTSRAP
jgi:hypothetical protein